MLNSILKNVVQRLYDADAALYLVWDAQLKGGNPDFGVISQSTKFQRQFIESSLGKLASSPIASEIASPTTNFTSFASGWDKASASLSNQSSAATIANELARPMIFLGQFHSGLANAKDEVWSTIWPPVQGPDPDTNPDAPKPTAADVTYFANLVSLTSDLVDALGDDVASGGDDGNVKSLTRQVGNEMSLDPSAGAMKEIMVPRGTWKNFIQMINRSDMESANEALGQFFTQIKNASRQVAQMVSPS